MVNILTILTWTTKKGYLADYTDESAKKAATKLWNAIAGGEIALVVLMAILTGIICWYYFFPFNEKPGRHYHPKWWWVFGGISLVVTFLASLLACYVIAKNPNFNMGFLLRVSIINTFYAVILFVVMSYVFIKTGKSNAYPWI